MLLLPLYSESLIDISVVAKAERKTSDVRGLTRLP